MMNQQRVSISASQHFSNMLSGWFRISFDILFADVTVHVRTITFVQVEVTLCLVFMIPMIVIFLLGDSVLSKILMNRQRMAG